MTFFTEVGKAVCAQLGTARTDALMRTALNSHLRGPMAQDGLPNSLRPRGGYDQEDPDKGGGGGYAFGSGPGDPNGSAEPPDPNELMQFVRLLANKLSPPDHAEFMMQLAEMVSQEGAESGDYGNGMGRGNSAAVNGGALDRSGRRSGKRSARDNMNTRQPGAMDSAIRQLNQQQGFDKRWSHLTGKIQVWG